mgnify:FL=1
MENRPHTPVLLHEVIENLDLKEGQVVVDGTVGFGGHAGEICEIIGDTGTLFALDADARALRSAEEHLQSYPATKIFIQGNFREIKELVAEKGLSQVDRVLFDLGVNSAQLDEVGRGFSFRRDEPLLMTLSDVPGDRLTAKDLLNTLSAEELAGIIYAYGEEQFSRRIATAVVEARDIKPIETTGELVKIIESAVPVFYTKRKIHPATKTFQALRIAVNDELEALKEGLVGAWDILSPSGRLAVISFHSLEARIVKNFNNSHKVDGTGRLIKKHAVKPTQGEKKINSRSRSAELRVIEKII